MEAVFGFERREEGEARRLLENERRVWEEARIGSWCWMGEVLDLVRRAVERRRVAARER